MALGSLSLGKPCPYIPIPKREGDYGIALAPFLLSWGRGAGSQGDVPGILMLRVGQGPIGIPGVKVGPGASPLMLRQPVLGYLWFIRLRWVEAWRNVRKTLWLWG